MTTGITPRHANEGRKQAANGAIAATPARWARTTAALTRSVRISPASRSNPAAADQRRTVAIALAGPRASAALLTALPLLGIALGAAMGARPWAVLLGMPAGRVLSCVGVLLDAVGVLWMRRILTRAQRS